MNYTDKIKEIINIFGIKQVFLAKIMGVTHHTIIKKIHNDRTTFTKQNYNCLILYIKENAKKLEYDIT